MNCQSRQPETHTSPFKKGYGSLNRYLWFNEWRGKGLHREMNICVMEAQEEYTWCGSIESKNLERPKGHMAAVNTPVYPFKVKGNLDLAEM